MATPRTINFITGNSNKLKEVKAILEPAIRVESLSLDIEEVQGSLEEVTIAKCRKAADTVGASLSCSNCYRNWRRGYLSFIVQSQRDEEG